MSWRAQTIRSGFTLIELMISVALVLLLMVGINLVFKTVGQTVGTSQAVADAVRDARAAQAVMDNDFKNMLTGDEAPFLIINSERIAAFRNRADELSDKDYDPSMTGNAAIDLAIRTIDMDGDGNEDPATVGTNLDLIPRAIYGVRNRRIDQINFFTRGNFPRQTGNDGTYVANMNASEAFVWYGHLKQPGPNGNIDSYTYPGTGIPDNVPTAYNYQSNRSNFYSSDWTLGRMGVLLRKPDTSGDIYDSSTPAVRQYYIDGSSALPARFPPLGQNSGSNDPVAPDASTADWLIQFGRYDLAGTTISEFRNFLINWIDTNVPPFPSAPPSPNWYDGGDGLLYRFQGDLLPTKPLSARGVARVSPTLLPHCSQFIVEYAGDFLTQDSDPASASFGWVQTTPVGGNPLQPDGQIDFVVNPVTRVKSTRWYGYPRDTNSNAPATAGQPDGVIVGGGAAAAIASFGANALCDVVPLRDVAIAATPGPDPSTFEGFPFERGLIPGPNTTLALKADYAARTTAGAPALVSRYRCAWGPTYAALTPLPAPYPKLIRFVFTIDDPSGRVADGQTFEFVFKLPE